MTTSELILVRAIEKAVKNGAKEAGYFLDINGKVMESMVLYDDVGSISALLYCYSHDFAKAFWGTDRYGHDHDCTFGHYGECCLHDDDNQKWQVHIREMVLEKDPIKYLAKFL